MKRCISLLISVALFGISMNGQQLAFPGAEGFGAYSLGGRGGTVVHVTNLNASGSGSLANAVSKPNRIVVFDVGGVIDITETNLTISSNITIAGQTAPGEGITVYGGRVIMSNTSNVVIRYLRMRGSINMNRSKCTLTMDNCSNVILDHCSISWGRWDNVHIANASDITWQNCIISEGIDPQRFGAITDGSWNWTVSHCLWANNKSRNPKMKCAIQYYNNVVYNYGNGIVGGHSSAEHYQDVINNYFITGPSSGSSNKYFDDWTATDHLYSTGNYTDGNCDGILNGTLITDYNGATPMSNPNMVCNAPMNLESAEEAYYSVVEHAGASRIRDSHDQRIISQLTSLGKKGSFIDNEQDVGGIGTLSGGTALVDTDGDGMPDEWEIANGLNPNKNDANGDIDGNGYTNIEDYINSLARKSDYLMSPTSVKAVMQDEATAVLTWVNSEEEATAIVVEQSEDGITYKQIAELSGDAITTTISGLTPKKIYYFRLKTVKGEKSSLYSETVSVNDDGMKAGGGIVSGTTEFTPDDSKVYRIINYGTKAYNSGTTYAGNPKYLTFNDNGYLGSTESFNWDDPSLLWEITTDPEDNSCVLIKNKSTGMYISHVDTLNGSGRVIATENAKGLRIVYAGDEVAAQSGTQEKLAMFRINTPQHKDFQLRPKNFADEWIWSNGTIMRADMVYTFVAIDRSIVTLYLTKLRNTISEARKTAASAQIGQVTLGYPLVAYEKLTETINKAQNFLDGVNIDITVQTDVDSVTTVLAKTLSDFKETRIMTLAGYDTQKLHNVYSYGTMSNASATNADASTERRYLVALKSADGERDSLAMRIGLKDADIDNGNSDAVSEMKEAQWTIAPGETEGEVYIRNEKTGTYMQIANVLSETPAIIYPYYAKEDNGKHAFYMQTSATNNRCLNVGTIDADGKGGTVSFAYPADRARLRWIIEELDIMTGIEEIADGKQQGRPIAIRYYNLQGVEINGLPQQGIYVKTYIYEDGSVKTQKAVSYTK